VKVIDIDLERRRISLSLRQANEDVDSDETDSFDAGLYGMNQYDENGNYIYPEGFDSDTNEWLPGHEEKKAEWEAQYAAAHAKWEAHKLAVGESKKADAAANADAEVPTSYSGETTSEGTLSDDAGLQALRTELADKAE
jgi:small subunit ribosomal protein S1